MSEPVVEPVLEPVVEAVLEPVVEQQFIDQLWLNDFINTQESLFYEPISQPPISQQFKKNVDNIFKFKMKDIIYNI